MQWYSTTEILILIILAIFFSAEILSLSRIDAWKRSGKSSKVRRINNRSPTILDRIQASIPTAFQRLLHIFHHTQFVSSHPIKYVDRQFSSNEYFQSRHLFNCSVLFCVGIERSDEKFWISANFYTEIVCFLTFNVCAMLGSLTTSWIQWVKLNLNIHRACSK